MSEQLQPVEQNEDNAIVAAIIECASETGDQSFLDQAIFFIEGGEEGKAALFYALEAQRPGFLCTVMDKIVEKSTDD
jgi:DUF1680 family protein